MLPWDRNAETQSEAWPEGARRSATDPVLGQAPYGLIRTLVESLFFAVAAGRSPRRAWKVTRLWNIAASHAPSSWGSSVPWVTSVHSLLRNDLSCVRALMLGTFFCVGLSVTELRDRIPNAFCVRRGVRRASGPGRTQTVLSHEENRGP